MIRCPLKCWLSVTCVTRIHVNMEVHVNWKGSMSTVVNARMAITVIDASMKSTLASAIRVITTERALLLTITADSGNNAWKILIKVN